MLVGGLWKCHKWLVVTRAPNPSLTFLIASSFRNFTDCAFRFKKAKRKKKKKKPQKNPKKKKKKTKGKKKKKKQSPGKLDYSNPKKTMPSYT